LRRYCDFLNFQDGFWIVEFAKFYWLAVPGGPRRITVPNFVKIGQSVAKILSFFLFFKMAAMGIRLGHIWTTNSEYLGVSVTQRYTLE